MTLNSRNGFAAITTGRGILFIEPPDCPQRPNQDERRQRTTHAPPQPEMIVSRPDHAALQHSHFNPFHTEQRQGRVSIPRKPPIDKTANGCWASELTKRSSIVPIAASFSLATTLLPMILEQRWPPDSVWMSTLTNSIQRHIAAGRVRLRHSLYAAALPAAVHWNRALKALYGRLLARGTAHKAALIVCARKLLISANTVVGRGQP